MSRRDSARNGLACEAPPRGRSRFVAVASSAVLGAPILVPPKTRAAHGDHERGTRAHAGKADTAAELESERSAAFLGEVAGAGGVHGDGFSADRAAEGER